MDDLPPSRKIRTKVIHVMITNACNLTCGGCNQLVGHFRKDQLFFLSLKEIRAGIQLAIAAARADWNQPWFPKKHRHLSIYGGEPTVHPDWSVILEMLKTDFAEWPFVILSNGRTFESRAYPKTGDPQYDYILARSDIKAHEGNIFWRISRKAAGQRFIPTLVAPIDILDSRDPQFYYDMARRRCPHYESCETTIYLGKGYFCSNAAAMDWLYHDGANGWELQPGHHPFDRTDEQVDRQGNLFCHRCCFAFGDAPKGSAPVSGFEQPIAEKSFVTRSNLVGLKPGSCQLVQLEMPGRLTRTNSSGTCTMKSTNSTANSASKSQRQLIVNADDAGMSHSVNMATIDAMENGIVTSASIMVPCPWFGEFAEYARSHPERDYGIHLTLTSEWGLYRWGPISPRDKVSSLIDVKGYLWQKSAPVLKAARLSEAEIELRAQIERARRFGVPFSHFDTHMGILVDRPDLFKLYVQLGIEYEVPVRVTQQSVAEIDARFPGFRDRGNQLLNRLADHHLPVLQKVVTFYINADHDVRKRMYENALTQLPNGVSELIVHCGLKDAELSAITTSAGLRASDHRIVTDPQIKDQLACLGVELTSWKQIRAGESTASTAAHLSLRPS
jgi:hypothetical protein